MSWEHTIKRKKICVICNAEFNAWNTNQKYCSQECKHKAVLKMGEVYRENARRKAEEQKKENAKKQALNDIAKKASEAGMTYGQYVAMMKL